MVVVAGHWTWAVLSSILAASVLGMASVQVLSQVTTSKKKKSESKYGKYSGV